MRLNKSAVLSLAVCAAAVCVSGYAPAASADADTSADRAVVPVDNGLRITQVGTDAMGTDTLRNRNKEFVTFKNDSQTTPVNLKGVLVMDGWAYGNTVREESFTCNKFEITQDLTLNPGEYVTVFNGWGRSQTVGNEHRFYANSRSECGTAGQFYNNNNDTVYVARLNSSDALEVYSHKSWDWNGGYTVSGQ